MFAEHLPERVGNLSERGVGFDRTDDRGNEVGASTSGIASQIQPRDTANQSAPCASASEITSVSKAALLMRWLRGMSAAGSGFIAINS